MTFGFGELSLDPERRELCLGGDVIALEPQAFDVLVHLVRNRDRVVAKEELMDTVWGGRFVSETAVTSRIKQVRRALGDDGRAQALVRTYHGRGYRFVADVHDVSAPEASPRQPADDAGHGLPDAPPTASEPSALTSVRGQRRVPFRLSGQGPPDLLLLSPAPPPVPSPSLARWFSDPARTELRGALGTIGRVIEVEAHSDALLEPDQVGETELAFPLLDVLDDAASERAVVLAEGVAARPVITFIEAHPERFAALVLLGALIDAPSGPDAYEWTSSLSGALPTMVLHRSGDSAVGVRQARHLAASLPSAEFRVLIGEADDAAADVGQFIEAISGLVHEIAQEEAVGRSLTSLVGLAGDDVEALSAVLVGLGGRRRRGPEGAVIVSFDGPANALRALASRRARGLVDEVGVGVAIDEVSRESYLISGHGVDVARQFAGLADPGAVLFPDVIKDLLAGSGLSSEPLPPVDLPYVGPHPVHRWRRP